MKKRVLFFILLTLFLIGFGYLFTFQSLDPDFGWHLRTGELILERGIPQRDWYSFTMPDFPWIAHSWLTDVFIYKIYLNFGFQILLLIFLGISALPFVILIHPSPFAPTGTLNQTLLVSNESFPKKWGVKPKQFLFYLLPVILGFLAILGFLGVRPQIITIFFIAILWKILSQFLENPKIFSPSIFFLPILFLIWANLHGGFFAGLFILFLSLILEIFKKTSLFKKLIVLPFFQGQNFRERSVKKISTIFIVAFLSFLATLINPYGLRIYEEIFLRTSFDNFLRFHITEWLPLFFGSPPVFLILYLALFLGLLIHLRKKIELTKLILILVFLILSLLNQRHFPIFVILSLPIFTQLLFYFKKKIIPERLNILFGGYKKWIVISVLLTILGWGFYPIFNYAFNSDGSLYYPEKALPFLKTLPLSENLLNEYNWGGYLIWKLPERKLFIDGRMPSWRKNSQFVFKDYIEIMAAEENFKELLEKYNLKLALLDKERKKEVEKAKKLEEKLRAGNKFLNFFQKHNWLAKILGFQLPQKNIYNELINLGWQVIYEDEIAIILKHQ